MTVVVFGASSQIGHFLLRRLSALHAPALAVSRRAAPAEALTGVQWLRAGLPELPPLPAPLDAVVSFGPMDGVAAWLSRQQVAPAAKLVATSSMSVISKRESAEPAERELARQLDAGERALAAQCLRLGIDWLILRPTLIYGAGLDKSLTPIARRARRWRMFPIPLAQGLRQPVHADDLAQAALAALALPKMGGRTVQIGGGERLPYREMFERMRASLPCFTVPLRLPLPLLRAVARFLPRLRGPITRLDDDLVADNSELLSLLGVQPRRFAPTAETWGMDPRPGGTP
ncbi:MAG: hypothetical protein QM599_11005 [Pseudoxanthomonas sp.]